MLVRILSYIALYSAISIMLSLYIPDAINVVTIVLSIAVVVFAAVRGGRFDRRVSSVYGSLAWSSGILLLFFVTYFAVVSAGVFTYVLYSLFLLFGLAISVIAAKNYGAVLQNVSSVYAVYGVVFGIVTAWFACAVPASVLPVIGSVDGVVSVDSVFSIAILMMYLVAIPEEFMARLFAFHIGASTVDVFSGAVAAVVLGYALHAITRYPNFVVLAIVTVVWGLITAFYAYTRSLVGAVLYHCVYNVVVICMYIYGVLTTFIVTLPIVASLAASVYLVKS